jgi:hypothetical protein
MEEEKIIIKSDPERSEILCNEISKFISEKHENTIDVSCALIMLICLTARLNEISKPHLLSSISNIYEAIDEWDFSEYS